MFERYEAQDDLVSSECRFCSTKFYVNQGMEHFCSQECLELFLDQTIKEGYAIVELFKSIHARKSNCEAVELLRVKPKRK
jgi:endogenous inhibitor of DNA gyrase (YacG/DUF329 family)